MGRPTINLRFATATACAVICLGAAGTALADGRVTATLEFRVAAHTKFIAAHAVWNCEALTCVADGAPDDTARLGGCEDLAHKVGHITGYVGLKPLDQKTLAKCNASAAPARPVGTASQ